MPVSKLPTRSQQGRYLIAKELNIFFDKDMLILIASCQETLRIRYKNIVNNT